MAWQKVNIITDSGESVQAQAPLIISASRATDIPAFYADWFFDRLRKGYCAWTNPFSGQRSYVSFENTRLVVFWSKNPRPLIPYLHILKDRGINCYVHFTINDYEREGLEKSVPPLGERIETFRTLASLLGTGKVIWRADPLILGEGISPEQLLGRIENIGDRLLGYADKLVVGFLNISSYKKVRKNLEPFGLRECSESEKQELASGIARLNREWGYELGMCSQQADFSRYGFVKNRCIDDGMILRHFSHDRVLMDFIGARQGAPDLFGSSGQPVRGRAKKDPGQRSICGCIAGKDIGQYNTCIHKCEYCYANISLSRADANHGCHAGNSFAETITGH